MITAILHLHSMDHFCRDILSEYSKRGDPQFVVRVSDQVWGTEVAPPS